MSDWKLSANFESSEAFLSAVETELKAGGMLVRGAALHGATAMDACTREVTVEGHAPVSVPARVAMVDDAGVAVLFEAAPAALHKLAAELRNPAPALSSPGGAGTALDRVKALSPGQKMLLAGHADREERFALLRDPIKTLHVHVLRNPRCGSDEALTAAKMTTLSPDALKYISEHPEWSNNAGIGTALVKNPQTPMPVALKMLDRIPNADVRMIAKTGSARGPIVAAARKMLQ